MRLSDKSPVEVGRSEKMSKSKKNVVDPDEIIRDYGADTARWFMLSDSPPERDLEWTEAGVTGAWRFQQRLFRIASQAIVGAAGDRRGQARDLLGRSPRRCAERPTRSIAGISADIEAVPFPTRRWRGSTNSPTRSTRSRHPSTRRTPSTSWAMREALEIFVRLIGPMTPHLAEELWHLLGHKSLLADRVVAAARGRAAGR